MNWLLARMKDGSFWRGLIWILTAFGITFRPEVWEQITAVGMAVAGLIGVLTSEKATRVDIQLPPIELVGRSVSPPETGQSRVVESIHPHVDSDVAPHSRMPVQPDYSPKEPVRPVDFGQSGWNG